MTQYTRGVANKSDGLARMLEGLDQINGLLRLCEIPQRAMSAWVVRWQAMWLYKATIFLGESRPLGEVIQP